MEVEGGGGLVELTANSKNPSKNHAATMGRVDFNCFDAQESLEESKRVAQSGNCWQQQQLLQNRMFQKNKFYF